MSDPTEFTHDIVSRVYLRKLEATRNETIEECARELEVRGRDDLATAIRALKDKL